MTDETIEPSTAAEAEPIAWIGKSGLEQMARKLPTFSQARVQCYADSYYDTPLYLASSVEATGGVTSPDYVMVPREPTKEMIDAGYKGYGGTVYAAVSHETRMGWGESAAHIYRKMLSAAPRSDDGSGLTPSKLEGSSAALRAQAIEECAKWHEGQFDKYSQLAKEAPDMVSNGIHADFAQFHMEAAAGIRLLKRQPAVPTIAQERDVGKPVAWSLQFPWDTQLNPSTTFRTREQAERYAIQYTKSDGKIATVIPLYLHPTTSPSAISEAPTSADAVKPTPSIEVGEMVERLKEVSDEFSSPYLRIEIKKANDLLIALDAERGRLRTALEPFAELAEKFDGKFANHCTASMTDLRRARSALGGV